MQRIAALIALALALAAGSTTTADAAVKWPAACTTMSCVNSHLNAVHTAQVSQNTRISTLQTKVNALESALNCLAEAPVTQYGDPAGSFGYWYTSSGLVDDGFPTSGMDFTTEGDPVSVFMIVDGCAAKSAAKSGNASHVFPTVRVRESAQRHG